ncbi:unnamed protein product [Schistosoma turkestanicum]|nr:unnamed protein product [Schistosoma turkestanicum]
MMRLNTMIKVIPKTVFIQKTSFVPPLIRKFSTNIYLSAPTYTLPEPPLPPNNEVVYNALGEPTLASLGLNSYWPSGWYQSLLETLHVHLELPWWGAIAASTIIIRLCVFPIMIRQRRQMANYTNVIPQFTILQERLTRARLSGNYIEVMRTSQEMNELMKSNDLNPLKTFKYSLLQVPVFLSVFTGIRGLVNLPVTSLQTGGTAWFTDLTASDPYYILPILSMSTLLLTLETSAGMSSQQTQTIQAFLRVLPAIGFVFVMNMPSALVWYWSVSNMVSLLQSLILRQSRVRSYLNFPSIQAPPAAIKKKRGFVAGFKEYQCWNEFATDTNNPGFLESAPRYWFRLCNEHAVGFGMSLILRQSRVRSYLNFPSIQAPPAAIKKKRGFVAGFKESLNNSRLLAELDSRERIDAKAWQKSGHKAPPVTFISDPTKLTSSLETLNSRNKTTDSGSRVQLKGKNSLSG